GLAVFFAPRKSGMSLVTHPLIQTVCRYTSEGSDCANDMQLQPGSFVPLPRFPIAGVTLACVVGKARSVGRLRFQTTRPGEVPIIESALLADEHDRVMALGALRWLGRL